MLSLGNCYLLCVAGKSMPLWHACKESHCYYLLSFMEDGQPQMRSGRDFTTPVVWWHFKLFPEIATKLGSTVFQLVC